ncbi:MAG TPA: HAD family hydrolase [Cyclobacteriaceae bacterium]|nr:HAD family hydrolase [Cyclobacteriaceae bacterium]
MAITAVFFDFIGTTILEKNNDVVLTCFQKAFADFNIEVGKDDLRNHRGKDKDQMIAEILKSAKKDIRKKTEVLQSFKKHFVASLDQFSESTDLDSTMEHLRSKKVKVGVGTGLPKDVLRILLEHFHWERFGFDYISTAEEIGKGRPNPEMIIDMMVKLHLNNFQFLKVGDTVADIQEGKNANVMTAVILSGTQSENVLRKENPDYVIKSLSELKQIV